MGAVVDVRCFPAADAEFTDAVLSIVAEVLGPDRESGPGAFRLDGLLAFVEERIREAYPNATLRRRDGLAEFGMTAGELWYAFRDGRLR